MHVKLHENFGTNKASMLKIANYKEKIAPDTIES